MLPNQRRCQRTLTEKLPHGPLTAPLLFPQGTDFHPKYTGENLTCTVQGLKRSSQYKFRVSEDDDAGVCVKKKACSKLLRELVRPLLDFCWGSLSWHYGMIRLTHI